MLRFFRRIRKGLLTDNKFSKYLLYAVGEILLVVIGILIALQVDNWNTQKLEIKELHGYLINIKNNLQADLIGLDEIKVFRDSSIAYSINYLKVIEKAVITIEDYATIHGFNTRYNVTIDRYFKSHNSGFESLKNSGYMGKLNGTLLEEKLNEYYYLIDKVNERETSLNNTIESLEIIAAEGNVSQRILQIANLENKKEFVTFHQQDIKELLNHPSMTGAHQRNAVHNYLPKAYRTAELLAESIIKEIDKTVNTQGNN
jgi:predicted DNA binding CopG/RHH family protein